VHKIKTKLLDLAAFEKIIEKNDTKIEKKDVFENKNVDNFDAIIGGAEKKIFFENMEKVKTIILEKTIEIALLLDGFKKKNPAIFSFEK
jgi:hypothetical protein